MELQSQNKNTADHSNSGVRNTRQEEQQQQPQVKQAESGSKFFIVERDYSHGDIIQFRTSELSPELSEYIELSELIPVLNTLNSMYAQAERLNWPNILDCLLGCATFQIYSLLFQSPFEKRLDKIHSYIKEQNRTLFKSRKLMLIDPINDHFMMVFIINLFCVLIVGHNVMCS
ncbi:hypothetical protein MP228_002970 [Amoeboaphelidium protococcarum]|nr:hypothetical protein MP228_002970 [Amoeboaphelidium protococcarum]